MTAYLFDTHLLLWSAAGDRRLPGRAIALMTDEANQLLFSAISIAEIAIKWQQKRPDFAFAPARIRADLLLAGYSELPLTGRHAAALAGLPVLHGDPFDRLLVAQAIDENLTLVTHDALLSKYDQRVMVV